MRSRPQKKEEMFEEFYAKEDSYEEEDSYGEMDYGQSYGEYAGSYAQDVMGYSDDVINDAFERRP